MSIITYVDLELFSSHFKSIFAILPLTFLPITIKYRHHAQQLGCCYPRLLGRIVGFRECYQWT